MASTNGKRKTKAPVYSADTMAMRYVLGILLVAFGVLLFFSVLLGIQGPVFAGTRSFAGGAAGFFGFLLPIPPVWSGILLILSAQRKTKVKPLLMVCMMMLILMALMHLVSTTGNPPVPLMEHFLETNRAIYPSPGAFDAFLARGYELGVKTNMGGGALGMLVAWPLWVMVGLIPSIILLVVLLIGLLILLFKMDFRKLFSFTSSPRRADGQTGQADAGYDQQAADLAWQKAQAARQQQSVRSSQQPAYGQEYGYSPPPQAYAPQGHPHVPAQSQPAEQPMGWHASEDAKPAAKHRHDGTHGFQPTQAERFRPVSPQLYLEDVTAPLSQTAPATAAQTAPSAPRRPSKLLEKLGRRQHEVQPPTDMPATQPPTYATADEFQQQFGGRRRAPAHFPPAPVQPAVHPYAGGQRDSMPTEWDEVSVDEDMRSFMDEVMVEALDDAMDPPVYRPVPQGYAPDGQAVYPQAGEISAASPAQSLLSVELPKPPLSPRTEQQPLVVPRAVPRVQNPPPAETWQPELKLPETAAQPAGEKETTPPPKPYIYPQMTLLKMAEPPSAVAAEEDAFRARRLEETLESFKIPSQVRHITHGPSISRFELEIASGIKVSKVTDLDRNIAMNMEVKSVRIEAPIPGKSLVGVEVPNRKVTPVTLREVLETEEMRCAKSALTVALGKDIAGQPILCDLARMPHLLIAGATGSGKSVCVNAMINSLLFRCSPQEVRLILIDPKVVELQCYNGIPHLLIPVVSDPHKAAGALEWAVSEMMDRYKKFQLAGVREINGYNGTLPADAEKMPRIVIIIDELADLMMTCKKDVEERICRLAQLARAAGIHLVVATQRPSVDVITGLIKANIPSRIAFKVSSFIDSRTIMDRPGAEKLLGYGDMLYLPNGEFTPTRIQGCFLTDGEVNRVTDFIRAHCESSYDPAVIAQLERIGNEANGEADLPEEDAPGENSLLAQVIEMTVQDGQISTSMLQRRFSIGYARAARLVDEMEARGIVSAKDGAKPRMCLISREQFLEMEQSGQLNSPL